MILAGVIIAGITIYKNELLAVDEPSNAKDVKFTIEEGSTVDEIANKLRELHLIKKPEFFKLYYKFNKKKELQAGLYLIKTDKSVPEIVNILEEGKVYKEIKILKIKEGSNVRQIAKAIAEFSDNKEEDVYKKMQDQKYLDELIAKYWFLTDKIKNKKLYYPLEGYLYPETYHFSADDLSLETIFGIMLDQTEKVLEPYKSRYIDENGKMKKNTFLPIEQVITFASVVELEAAKTEDRKNIAGVFLNRLTNNMSMGSDVTTYYAIKVNLWERDLTMKELNAENPYNTRGPNMEGKLPIGPVCNPSIDSINAVFNYTKSDDFYFVSDKNGKIYTTKNLYEHEKIIEKLQAENLWYEHE